MHAPLPPRAADVSRRWALVALVAQVALIGAVAGGALAAHAADPTDEPGPVGPTAVVAGTVWADAAQTGRATAICVALLEPGTGTVVDAQLARSGSYSFPAVAPDVYTLRFADCDASRSQPYATTYLGDGQRLDGATRFAVTASVDILGLDAHLVPAGSSAVIPVPPPRGVKPSVPAPAPAPARPGASGAASGAPATDADLPTLSLPEETSATPTPAPSTTRSSTPTAAPAPQSQGSTPVDGTGSESDAGALAVEWIVGGVAALALALAIVAVILLRRRTA